MPLLPVARATTRSDYNTIQHSAIQKFSSRPNATTLNNVEATNDNLSPHVATAISNDPFLVTI
jgi:hypothetical protein